MIKHRFAFCAWFNVWLMISVIMIAMPTSAQTLSHPDIAVLVDLWRKGELDSVRSILPLYERKYSALPELLFIRAALNADGNAAFGVYEELEKKHPNQALADHCLLRIIQYHVSYGRYQTASGFLNRLQNRFPRSPVLSSAIILFPESGLTTTDTLNISSGKNETWTLQLGAFAERANAEKWMKKMQAKGLQELSVREKISGGKILYAVFYGSFASREEALEAGQTLKNRYQIDYSLIKK